MGGLHTAADLVNISGNIASQSLTMNSNDILLKNGNFLTTSTPSAPRLSQGTRKNDVRSFVGGPGHGGSGGASIGGISGAPYGSYIYPSRPGSAGTENSFSMIYII